LNGDVEKVLEHCDRSDRQLRRRERETFEVNQLFDEFERRAAQDVHRAIDVRLKEEKCADQPQAFENPRDQILEYLSQNEKLVEVMELTVSHNRLQVEPTTKPKFRIAKRTAP
jgi:hypothetical protein